MGNFSYKVMKYFLFSLFCSVSLASTAQTVTVTNEHPDGLVSVISSMNLQAKAIQSLKLVGVYSGSDLRFLRDSMCNAGALRHLDMSDAIKSYYDLQNNYDAVTGEWVVDTLGITRDSVARFYDFDEFTKLKTLTIPSVWVPEDSPSTTLADLEAIEVDPLNWEKTKDFSQPWYRFHPFHRLDSLQQIKVPADNPYFVVENGILYNKDQAAIVYCPPCNPIGDFVAPESVIDVSYGAFRDNIYLTSFTSYQPLSLMVGNNAFYGCTNLKKFYSNAKYFNAIDDSFTNCGGPLTVTLGKNFLYDPYHFDFLRPENTDIFLNIDDDHQYYKLESNALLSKDGTNIFTLASYPNPDEYAIPSSVSRVVSRSLDLVFSHLKRLVIPSSVKKIDDSGIRLPEGSSIILNSSDVIIDEYSIYFSDRDGINSDNILILGENVKDLAILEGIRGYDKIIIEPSNPYFVQQDGLIYNNSKSDLLKGTGVEEEIVLPETVQTIAYQALSFNANLKQVVLPASLAKIEAKAFWACSNLISMHQVVPMAKADQASVLDSTLVIPTGVEIGEAAFANTGFSYVSLPVSLTEIPNRMMEGCFLSKVEIPSTVTFIGDDAFNSAKVIYFYSESPIAYQESWNRHETIYVPKGSKEAYINAGFTTMGNLYGNFTNIIELEATTGISQVVTNTGDTTPVVIYDLQGRRLNDISGKHGLFIVNGKKVVK